MTHPVITALGLGDNESGTYLGHGEGATTRDAGIMAEMEAGHLSDQSTSASTERMHSTQAPVRRSDCPAC